MVHDMGATTSRSLFLVTLLNLSIFSDMKIKIFEEIFHLFQGIIQNLARNMKINHDFFLNNFSIGFIYSEKIARLSTLIVDTQQVQEINDM
jgi:hypothetical protein